MTLNHQAKIVSICIIRTHTELKIVKSCTTNDNSLNKGVEILTKRDNERVVDCLPLMTYGLKLNLEA